MTLNFIHLREVNVARCINSFGQALESWSVPDWMVALGGEVGEALNVIKKLNRARDGIVGNTKDAADLRIDLGDELADAVIYLDLLLARQKLHFTFGLDFAMLADEAQSAMARAMAEDIDFDMSSAGLHAMRGLGDLADSLQEGGAVLRNALTLLLHLASIADLADIDLGEAVVRKFNATSEKRGAAERLAA